jgi:hypothetical protein
MKMWRRNEKGKKIDAGEKKKRGQKERRDGKYEERIRTEKQKEKKSKK